MKSCNDQLSQKLISEYWHDFIHGTPWNFYLCNLRNQEKEHWCTTEDWVQHAKKCIEKNIGTIRSLEILLTEEKTEYMEFSERIVSEFQSFRVSEFQSFMRMVHMM